MGTVTVEASSGGDNNAKFISNGEQFNFITCLQSIEIPDGVTIIDYDSFDYEGQAEIGLVSIVLPESVIRIGDYAFNNCHLLTNVSLNAGLTDIGDEAFKGCPITSVTIPANITNWGNSTFADCESLTSVIFTNGLGYIANSTFQNCTSLESIMIPGSVSIIYDYAFCDCTSLLNVTLGYGVRTITTGAFSGCELLESITFPETIVQIDDGAFYNCSSLTFIEFLGDTPPELIYDNYHPFEKVPTTCIIYIPYGTLETYTSAEGYPDTSTYTYIERPAT